MALINDPDQLTTDLEITLTPLTETITLNNGSGNLDDFGITGQAMYSFFKEEWKDDVTTPDNLMKYSFPMLSITNEQFEFGNNGSKFSNWRLASAANRKLVRKAGFREYDDAGQVGREYVCVNTLGTIESTSKTVGNKATYFFANETSATEFTYAGPVDEVIQIFGDATVDPSTTTFNNRAQVLTVSIRTFGNTYGRSTTTEIEVPTLTYKVERFPVAEALDNVIADLATEAGGLAALETEITTLEPYTDMTIAWFAAVQNKTGFNQAPGNADFGVIVDGDVSVAQEDGGGAATAEEIYAFVQYQLTQATDINDGAGGTATSYPGLLQPELLNLASTGNTLSTNQVTNPDGGGTGVYVDTFANDDRNRVTFTASNGSVYSFPFVATGTLSFNANVTNDATARYWLYYQYTRSNTVADLDITGASGSDCTLGSTASVDFTSTVDFGTPALADQDYIEITGFTNEENNGVYQITAAPTANTLTVTKQDGATVVNETATGTSALRRAPLNSPDAEIVQDNADIDLGDVLVSGNSTISFTYDFDGDTTAGRNTTASPSVVLKVIGAPTCQYADTDLSIARSVGQNLPITATLERNYNGAQ